MRSAASIKGLKVKILQVFIKIQPAGNKEWKLIRRDSHQQGFVGKRNAKHLHGSHLMRISRYAPLKFPYMGYFPIKSVLIVMRISVIPKFHEIITHSACNAQRGQRNYKSTLSSF